MNLSKLVYRFRLQPPKLILQHNVSSPRLIQSLRPLHRKSIYKTEEAKKIKFYVVHRYVEYLKNYDKILEKSAAMKVYRVFVDGLKLFITDLKDYFHIVQLLNKSGNAFKALNRRELELYHQMPKDMRKIAPVLVIAALPFVPYVLFPLAYMFPKWFLTSHFWTVEEKNLFSSSFLKNRLLHNKPVFRHLQSQMPFLKTENNKLFLPWAKAVAMLGSGTHPSIEQLLTCKELFSNEPYHLYYLSRNHIKHLGKLHDIRSGWFRRTRLGDRALILIEMDKAIMREGGVHNLPIESLRNACYIRGLNPTNMSTEDMVKWLQNWIRISHEVDKESLSLLLHLPVLLGYNEPSNWTLIYPKK